MSPVQSRVSAGPNNTSSFCRLCRALLFSPVRPSSCRRLLLLPRPRLHATHATHARRRAHSDGAAGAPRHGSPVSSQPRESPPHALRRAALPVRPVRPKVQPGQQPQAAHPHAHWREAVRVHRVRSLDTPARSPTAAPSARSALATALASYVGFSPCVRSLTDHRQKKDRSKEERYQPASLAQKRGKEETLCRDQDSNLGYCGHNARY